MFRIKGMATADKKAEGCVLYQHYKSEVVEFFTALFDKTVS
jgi:hypothetical protein